ncbi:MAG: DNA repair protein RadC [Candidatus Wallbacteria bacterium]|nr:DNA repair protein RadC [Candidatus Wallbacteria bacterium]
MKKGSDKSTFPREKLALKGAEYLSDKELLAILLGSGTEKHDVFKLADEILKKFDSTKGKLRLKDLTEIEGIGQAKASIIIAALEFSRRRIKPEGLQIKFPTDVMPLIANFADRKQEHFLCISVNGANEVIAVRVVTIGIVNKTLVHPREVFADPIVDRASSIIVAHNHPAGGLTPSREDIDLTRKLKDAGEILGIKLLDHIIFNQKGHYSFLADGKL